MEEFWNEEHHNELFTLHIADKQALNWFQYLLLEPYVHP